MFQTDENPEIHENHTIQDTWKRSYSTAVTEIKEGVSTQDQM